MLIGFSRSKAHQKEKERKVRLNGAEGTSNWRHEIKHTHLTLALFSSSQKLVEESTRHPVVAALPAPPNLRAVSPPPASDLSLSLVGFRSCFIRAVHRLSLQTICRHTNCPHCTPPFVVQYPLICPNMCTGQKSNL